MEITLPYCKKKAVLKDFIPHGVAAAHQQAMFKGMKMNMGDFNPDKGDLVEKFGEKVMKKLDAMPEKEYDVEFRRLQGELLASKMDIDGVGLGNIEAANMSKILGMVKEVDGKKPDEETINDLEQSDYQKIMETIAEIENVPLGVESSDKSKKLSQDTEETKEQGSK